MQTPVKGCFSDSLGFLGFRLKGFGVRVLGFRDWWGLMVSAFYVQGKLRVYRAMQFRAFSELACEIHSF